MATRTRWPAAAALRRRHAGECCTAECRAFEGRTAESRAAECRIADCRIAESGSARVTVALPRDVGAAAGADRSAGGAGIFRRLPDRRPLDARGARTVIRRRR